MSAPWVKALQSVDWPRVLHNGALYLRALRGDATMQSDAERATDLAQRTKRAIENVGRQAAGCMKPAPCQCPFCKEEKAP